MRSIMIPSNGIGCVVYSAVVQKQLDQRRKLSDAKGLQRVSTFEQRMLSDNNTILYQLSQKHSIAPTESHPSQQQQQSK